MILHACINTVSDLSFFLPSLHELISHIHPRFARADKFALFTCTLSTSVVKKLKGQLTKIRKIICIVIPDRHN